MDGLTPWWEAGSGGPMRVLYAAAEAAPLAKTGGLADVAAALPSALRRLGADVRLLMPAYAGALASGAAGAAAEWFKAFAGAPPARLRALRPGAASVPGWLLECPELFGPRPGGCGPYLDDSGRDWPDNHRRFALLSHVAAALAAGRLDPGWRADVLHANDWHTALAPWLLLEEARHGHGAGRPPATVLSLHNLAFQGMFPSAALAECGLGPDAFRTEGGLEFHGAASLLKAGIAAADRLVAVSATYAREILTPEHGHGLDGLLRSRADRLCGIRNGVDYGIWEPAGDVHLPMRFSAADATAGKAACAAALRAELGLRPDPAAPLLAFASRLTDQKMADTVAGLVPWMVAQGAQLALQGRGDVGLEARFAALAAACPGTVAVRIGYDEGLAHRLLAGADILLHPARFEPCGLLPLYAMRYGTLPVVRRVGGLAETVADAGPDGEEPATDATGFAFDEPAEAALRDAIAHALAVRRERVGVWRRMCANAMAADFGWGAAARAHLDLYAAVSDSAAPVAAERG